MCACTTITNRQCQWINNRRSAVDPRGYVLNLNDNLFEPLGPQTEVEFRAGRGNELGDGTRPGNMAAPYSSSALVVNFFQWFRENGRSTDAAELLVPGSAADGLEFESQRMVVTAPANLDLEFRRGPLPIGVESKFREPYSGCPTFDFSPAYFDSKQASLWTGLPRCRSFANGPAPSYKHLAADQLIKHILGLARAHGGPDQFHLVYLWYEVRLDGGPHPESVAHSKEIVDFSQRIDPCVRFTSLTYQDLFARMLSLSGCAQAHVDYLKDRYF